MNWKSKTIAIGAVFGLLIGLAGAYIIIQRSEENQALPNLSAGDGVKVGLGVLTLLRLVSDIAEPSN